MRSQTGHGGRDDIWALFAQFDVCAKIFLFILPKTFEREGFSRFVLGEIQFHIQFFRNRLCIFLVLNSHFKAMRETRQKFLRPFNGFGGLPLIYQSRRHGVQLYLQISYFHFADFLVNVGDGTCVVRRAVAVGKNNPEQKQK